MIRPSFFLLLAVFWCAPVLAIDESKASQTTGWTIGGVGGETVIASVNLTHNCSLLTIGYRGSVSLLTNLTRQRAEDMKKIVDSVGRGVVPRAEVFCD